MANKLACCSLGHWQGEANTAADCCLRKSRSRPRDDALAIISWLGLHAGGCLTLVFYSPAAIGSSRFECGGGISVSNHETPSCICLMFGEREVRGRGSHTGPECFVVMDPSSHVYHIGVADDGTCGYTGQQSPRCSNFRSCTWYWTVQPLPSSGEAVPTTSGCLKTKRLLLR